ncbi:hypothetical protein ABT124_42300 [Streptomyces sp. NPDC001982]|uniref:hypothetical protein n=1 Tax=Streptomyces sp. NPDC001982 TaxID=3154405 RepID=UPI0033176F49
MILFVPVRPLATDGHGEMCRKDMGRESVALFKEFPSQIFLHDVGEVLAFSDDPAVRIDHQGVSIGVHKICEAIECVRSGGFHGGSRYSDCPAGLDASTSSSPGRPGFTRQPGRTSHEWVIPPARQGSSAHLVSLDQVMLFTGLEVLNDGAHGISHRSDERVRKIARPRFLTPRPSDDETPVDNGSLSAKCLSGMHESVSE